MTEQLQKPEGVSEDEWRLILGRRAEQAEKNRKVAVWAEPISQLSKIIAGSDGAYDDAAGFFIECAASHGWELEIEAFVIALMEQTGFRQIEVRGHGRVWKKSRG